MPSDECNDCKRSPTKSYRIVSSFEMAAGEIDSKALCIRCAKLRGMVFADLYVKDRLHKALPPLPAKSPPGLRRLAEDEWIQNALTCGKRLTPELLESLHEEHGTEVLALEAVILEEWAEAAKKSPLE